MTKTQQAIILTSIIGSILDEYQDKESVGVISILKHDCKRFMMSQSGTKFLPFVGARIVNHKLHEQFIRTVMIGDRIWKKTIDRYAKQGITIEATALIKAVFDFSPELMAKYVHISQKKIDALISGATDGDANHKRDGAIIGGYLTELLAQEMGLKINGRLRALKNKIEREMVA